MPIHEFSATTIEGAPRALADLKGQVVLVVNVASKCGYTPQYQGLEALYRRYHDRGFTILGFPCDQFGHQEPGSEAEIQQFCSASYDVTFPMFAKIAVNGPNTHPLWHYLKTAKPGVLGTAKIKWNFTKFLIGKDGEPVKRYAPADTPESIDRDVAKLLDA